MDDGIEDDFPIASLSLTSAWSIEVDAFLANEMYQMSVDDRNKIQEELHGVGFLAPEESPQASRVALEILCQEVDAQVQALRASADESSRSFWEGFWMPASQHYLKSQVVCLKYLRADLFDIPAAARRMVTHLRLLHKFFGTCALQRQLRHSDLSKAEQDLLRAGNMQVLPSRDRSGRLVTFYYGYMATDGTSDTTRVSGQAIFVLVHECTMDDLNVFTQFLVSCFFLYCAATSLSLLHACGIRGRGNPKERLRLVVNAGSEGHSKFQSHP